MPQRVTTADPAHRAHLVGNPNSELWLTAVHEAGHAVITLAVGGTFRLATLRKSEGGTVAGHVAGPRCPTPHLEAVMTAAGFTSESIADTLAAKAWEAAMEVAPEGTVYVPRAHVRAKGDMEDLRELIKNHGLDLDEIFDSAATAAHVLYPLIEVVAAALMEPKPLRGLNDLEIVMALSMNPAAWMAAAERLLNLETPTGAPPAPWLARYVRNGLG